MTTTHFESPETKARMRGAPDCPATRRDWERTVCHRDPQPCLVRADKGLKEECGCEPRGAGKSFEKYTGR